MLCLLRLGGVVAVAGAGAGAPAEVEDTSLVVFCVDVSGSMCVTTAIQGKMQLKYGPNLIAYCSTWQLTTCGVPCCNRYLVAD